MLKTTILLNYFIKKMKNSKNLSPLAIKAYQSDLSSFIDFDSDKLEERDIINYVNHLRTVRQLKDTSIKRKLISINMFYECLIADEIITNNPLLKIKFNFKKEKRHDSHFIVK